MASVVEFRRVGLHLRPAGRGPSGSAEIVLFPGVRYERAPDSAAEKRSPRRRSRRRDHIEFDD